MHAGPVAKYLVERLLVSTVEGKTGAERPECLSAGGRILLE